MFMDCIFVLIYTDRYIYIILYYILYIYYIYNIIYILYYIYIIYYILYILYIIYYIYYIIYICVYMCLSMCLFVYLFVYLLFICFYMFLPFSTSIVFGTKPMLHFGYGPSAPTKESACKKTWEPQVWDGSSNFINSKPKESQAQRLPPPQLKETHKKFTQTFLADVLCEESKYRNWNSTSPRSCSAAEISRPDPLTVNGFVQEPKTW